jgi:hypothetical protein
MSKFIVTGAKQNKGARGDIEWYSYAEALALEFDSQTHEVRELIRYTTPDAFRPDESRANHVFKAGSIWGNDLVLCSQTEVLVFDGTDHSLRARVTHPWFNDLHHAMVNSAGNILVANTGLDMVMEVGFDGREIRHWGVLDDEDPWDRFDRETDYRKVVTTKPHRSHPNYVFEHDGQIWVTRFEQRNSMCLTRPGRMIEVGGARIHDGHIEGERIYFTSVDGFVVISSLESGRVLEMHDLNKIIITDNSLGWCRGIAILDEDRVLVGFSRLRPSKFKENLRWVKYKAGMREDAGPMPTRVVCFNLRTQEAEWTLNLENQGLNAVFSILEAPE